MKKSLLLILLAGFTLTGCSDGKSENPFIGRWSFDHKDLFFKLNGADKDLKTEAATSEAAADLFDRIDPRPAVMVEFTEDTMIVYHGNGGGPESIGYFIENGVFRFIVGGVPVPGPGFKYKFEDGFLVKIAGKDILDFCSSSEGEDYREGYYGNYPSYEEATAQFEGVFGPSVTNIEMWEYWKKVPDDVPTPF